MTGADLPGHGLLEGRVAVARLYEQCLAGLEGVVTPIAGREAERRRILKPGSIEFDGGVIDCAVRNPSKVGAALDVVTPVGIPDRFTLVVPGDHLRLTSRIVWRKAARIGIRFEIES